MAIVTTYLRLNMNYNTEYMPTTLDNNHIQFFGMDFHHEMDIFGGDFTDLTTATINSIVVYSDEKKIYEVNGLSHSAYEFIYSHSEQKRIYIFSDDDIFNGFTKDDVIRGFAGNDKLYGNKGNDTLEGGSENDNLIGGWDKDVLIGGTGTDTFSFNYLTESTSGIIGRDVITDFNHAEADKINLHDVDANLLLVGNQDFRFIGSAKFSAAGQIRFDAAAHVLYASNDADTQAEFSVQLTGVNSLQASDFIL